MTNKKPYILLIDHHNTTRQVLDDLFEGLDVASFVRAVDAIEKANSYPPALVVVELSLAGHSGLEFLYEFRTYLDWKEIPVIVYSSIRLEPAVKRSKTWEQLKIAAYLYKPETSLSKVRSVVEKSILLPQVS